MGNDLIAFSKYLKSVHSKTFEWGVHDCVFFTCNGVKAMTGVNIHSKWDDVNYSNRAEAMEIVDNQFEGDLDNAFTEVLGEPHERYLKAMRGDVVRITDRGQHAYGLVDDTGRGLKFITEDNELQTIPLSCAEKIWSLRCLKS